jgi:hypothetical protein
MQELWKIALGIAGLGAVSAFVFWSLYKDWLKLGIFQTMTRRQQFALFVLFLVLTFLFAISGLITYAIVTSGAHSNRRSFPTRFADDPVVGQLSYEIPYGFSLIGKAQSGIFDGEAQTVLAEDDDNTRFPYVMIDFDVTNPSELEMRIVSIFVDVIRYEPVEAWEVNAYEAAGETRKYFCTIKPSEGSYEAIQKSDKYDFIKLAPGELEHFSVAVTTESPGIYLLGVSMEISTGGEIKKIGAGSLENAIAFFDDAISNPEKYVVGQRAYATHLSSLGKKRRAELVLRRAKEFEQSETSATTAIETSPRWLCPIEHYGIYKD